MEEMDRWLENQWVSIPQGIWSWESFYGITIQGLGPLIWGMRWWQLYVFESWNCVTVLKDAEEGFGLGAVASHLSLQSKLSQGEQNEEYANPMHFMLEENSGSIRCTTTMVAKQPEEWKPLRNMKESQSSSLTLQLQHGDGQNVKSSLSCLQALLPPKQKERREHSLAKLLTIVIIVVDNDIVVVGIELLSTGPIIASTVPPGAIVGQVLGVRSEIDTAGCNVVIILSLKLACTTFLDIEDSRHCRGKSLKPMSN